MGLELPQAGSQKVLLKKTHHGFFMGFFKTIEHQQP